MSTGIHKDNVRYSFYSGRKIRVYERHLPSLLGSRLTVERIDEFFKIVSRLDPIYVPSQFRKLWNILGQHGVNSDLKLQSVVEFQLFLREYAKYYHSGVVEKELGYWGDEEQNLYAAKYNTTAG